MYDVCIVGGGASGMATAITIGMKTQNLKIVVLEKKSCICSKVKAAGNGRCNISNVKTTTFGDSVKFFRKIGVEIKSNKIGWAFPLSERGEDVAYAFERAADAYGIIIKKNFTVTEISKVDGYFQIMGETDNSFGKVEKITAKKVVISSGGKSYPEFGTTGDSYRFVRKLGHTVNKIRPSLAPIECESDFTDCSGTRVKGEVSLLLRGCVQSVEEGEIQFTDYGLTGICVFNLSREIVIDEMTRFQDYTVKLNLLSRYKPQEIFLVLDIRRGIKDLDTKDLMMSIVNRNIAEKLLSPWIKSTEKACQLTDDQLKQIVYAFMNVDFIVSKVQGWRKAQVTSGGVTFSEFNYESMESLKCKGLYLTGEVIDLNGPCGGYNLENAWNTGRKAGSAICIELSR